MVRDNVLLPTMIVFVVAVLAVVVIVLYTGESSVPVAPDMLLGAVTANDYLSPTDAVSGEEFFTVTSDGLTQSGSLPLTVTVGGTDRIFYEKFYVSTNADEWKAYNFSDAEHGWVLTSTSETKILPASLVGDDVYAITFSCKAVAGQWECGCDTNGNCNKWAIVKLQTSACTSDADCTDASKPICNISTGVCGTGRTTCQEEKKCNGKKIEVTHVNCSTEIIATCTYDCAAGLCMEESA